MIKYRITPFGKDLIYHFTEPMNFLKQELFALLEKFANKERFSKNFGLKSAQE